MLLDCNIEQIYNNLHKRNNAFRDPWSNIFKVSILLIRMLWHSQALSMPVVSWRCLERSRGMTFWKQVEKEMFWKWLHYYIYVLPDQDLFFWLGRRLHTFWYGKPGLKGQRFPFFTCPVESAGGTSSRIFLTQWPLGFSIVSANNDLSLSRRFWDKVFQRQKFWCHKFVVNFVNFLEYRLKSY